MAMLTALQVKSKSERVFGKWFKSLERCFFQQRQALTKKLRNPRIHKISFHTFRHFKATMEYHKTRDILHVMKVLGHKNIKNTLIYTHLIDFGSDEYVSKVATTVQEARQLVETGFEYVTDMDGIKIFRKRK